MNNIEIGEYVRTDFGYILKNTASEHKHIIDNIEERDNKFIYGRIVKHSKNLIDLIEVGDYVNGYKVVETFKDSKKENELWLSVVVSSKMIKEPLREYFDKEMIKSIVTKERFEEIEYKV